LIELAGSVPAAKDAIKKVADWANSRKLDYAIETVFKNGSNLIACNPKKLLKTILLRGSYGLVRNSPKVVCDY